MSKKAILALTLLVAIILSGCKPSTTTLNKSTKAVNITVVTTFAGNDGNASNYEKACKEWEKATGNIVNDMSAVSDETFKTRVITDFETSSEADVLFFFTGADANNFIRGDRVVPIEEIRESYPDYASNMQEELLPVSIINNRAYAVPVNGYWEAMFVNKEVLAACGIEVPGKKYSWTQFMADCEKIKENGYTPIACALGNIPHYVWEYAIFNRTGTENHLVVPSNPDTAVGQNWVEAMNDIKLLYEKGYFPQYTNSASDESIFNMFMDGKAAFLIDGSWKIGSIVQNCREDLSNPDSIDKIKLEKYTVTYVPSMGNRENTDLIGGMSMGYYISRRAWENPEKRDVVVSFVMHMTSDDVVKAFAGNTSNILKDREISDVSSLNSLEIDALNLINDCTSLTPAVQDIFQGECRESTFDNMPNLVNGRVDIKKAVSDGLKIYWERTN